MILLGYRERVFQTNGLSAGIFRENVMNLRLNVQNLHQTTVEPDRVNDRKTRFEVIDRTRIIFVDENDYVFSEHKEKLNWRRSIIHFFFLILAR